MQKPFTTALLVVSAALMAGGAADAQAKKKPAKSAKPPVAAPAAPIVEAPPAPVAPAEDPLAVAASYYAAFQTDLTDLRAVPITSAKALDDSFNKAVSHNGAKVGQGWMAYAALVAAQSPKFTEEVRKAGKHYGLETFLAYLDKYPSYMRSFPGADDAMQRVMAAASSDAIRVSAIGGRFQQEAYGLQSGAQAKWARTRAIPAATRIQQLSTLNAAIKAHDPAVVAKLTVPAGAIDANLDPALLGGRIYWDAFKAENVAAAAVVSLTPAQILQERQEFERKATMNAILTLAAIHALGESGNPAAPVAKNLGEQNNATCLEMVQLNVNQCVRGARERYEHAFCLGQHAVSEVGACVRRVVQ